MNKYIGSSFDDFLAEEGILAEVQAEAVKRVIVWQLQDFMNEKQITKTELARKLNTSRAGLDRLLDEKNLGVTLGTLANVAQVTGKRLRVNLV
ncbi:MAG: helix-turn-helix transcriptional regulator [Gammaproteobacteria bacterium]|nr:helix-turn-helix transcriptional regulator [Gammaproteobacteria bacterium]MDP2140478.1 helix-turn-helix transcriptional regulator [Gammaproteobacteria bacterium]MDP2349517.1 helix-turn-helix transcriptional regulator [Gammaproteobacteria bacterium]